MGEITLVKCRSTKILAVDSHEWIVVYCDGDKKVMCRSFYMDWDNVVASCGEWLRQGSTERGTLVATY